MQQYINQQKTVETYIRPGERVNHGHIRNDGLCAFCDTAGGSSRVPWARDSCPRGLIRAGHRGHTSGCHQTQLGLRYCHPLRLLHQRIHHSNSAIRKHIDI